MLINVNSNQSISKLNKTKVNSIDDSFNRFEDLDQIYIKIS